MSDISLNNVGEEDVEDEFMWLVEEDSRDFENNSS